ncbi:MAG: hypothetical protein SVT56_11535 [Chloroflexota bacterium]|nr:hypothetical protein [Chloroflexota bacterium]
MLSAKQLFLIILLVATLLTLIIIGVRFAEQIACEGQLFNDNLPPTPSQQILGERLIGQSFVSPRDKLNRIDLFLQTYERQNTGDILLQLLEISDDNRNNPLAGTKVFETTFNATIVRDRTWHHFTFPSLENSTGKHYLIVLQSPNSVNGNAITIGGIQQDVYEPGLAFTYAPDLGFSELTPVNGDIMFRACYEMTIVEKLQIFSEQITKNRPGLWQEFSTYLFLFGSYTILLIIFFWRVLTLE